MVQSSKEHLKRHQDGDLASLQAANKPALTPDSEQELSKG